MDWLLELSSIVSSGELFVVLWYGNLARSGTIGTYAISVPSPNAVCIGTKTTILDMVDDFVTVICGQNTLKLYII